jgi:hypothetical protein
VLEALLAATPGDGRRPAELLMTRDELAKVRQRLETAGKPVEVMMPCE